MNAVVTITLVAMASSGLIIGLILRRIKRTKQNKINNKFDNYDFHLGEMTSEDVPGRFTKRESRTSQKIKVKTTWKEK